MFYGLEGAKLERVYQLVKELRDLYNAANIPSYVGDMMITFGRNHSFMDDIRFCQIFDETLKDTNDQFKVWKFHVLVWAARTASELEGDFVECGVYKGLYSYFLSRYLDFERRDKKFYLYDTFAGVDEAYSTPEEMEKVNSAYDLDGLHEFVLERFKAYENAIVIKGVVPDILHEVSPEKIAYLHLDMNAAAAEVGALDVLFERVVRSGVVVFDDYGCRAQRNLYCEVSAWMNERGHAILEVPTGQGVVIKH